MRLSETRDRFVTEFTYPVEHETVIETMGEVELDAPHGEPESIDEVLNRAGTTETYRSADELYDSVITYVGDGYIGRKFYDDRSPNSGDTKQIHF